MVNVDTDASISLRMSSWYVWTSILTNILNAYVSLFVTTLQLTDSSNYHKILPMLG